MEVAEQHIVCFNISEKGHLHPTFAVVKEMRRRGIKVTYVVFPWSDGALSYAEQALSPITNFVNLYDITSWRYTGEHGPQGALEDTLKWMTTLSPAPTAILHDPFAYLGVVVASKLGLPLITSISNTPVVGPTVGRWTPVEEIEELSQQVGVDLTHNSWLDLTLPNTSKKAFSIMYTIPELVRHNLPQEIIDKIFFAGSLFARRAEGEALDPVAQEMASQREKGKKIWLISLGTVVAERFRGDKSDYQIFITHLFDTVLEILRERTDIEAYGIFIGQLGSYLEGKELPPNFHPCSYVTQLQVLPQVDIFLTHAGANSFNEGLNMGIPLILVPFTGDQLGNSEAAESLGVGYYFRHDEGTSLNAHTDPWRSSLTPETMKQAIEFALSESTKQKATELANEYHRHTPELVVDNILAWLKSQQEGK